MSDVPPAASRRRLRITPALVVATAALVVALAGTGYAALAIPANSVGTLQLKNGAVTNVKIQPGAGVSVLYTHASPASTVPAGGVTGQFATCPKGTYPVSGGAGTNGVPGVTVLESLPYNSVKQAYTGAADSWATTVQNTTAQPQPFTAYVVCVSAVSATSTY